MQETVVYLKKITQPEGEKKRAGTGTLAVRMGAVPDGNAGTVWAGWRKDNDRTDAHGKPYLPGHPQICFNISHSGEYAACAFASIPIGTGSAASTAALPGSAWQNGIFPPKTRNALPQRRMLKRCFSGSGPRRRATASGGEPVFRVLLERKRKRASARISVRRKDMKAPSGQRSP